MDNQTAADRQNMLTTAQKWWAGILLIVFTLVPAFFIMAIWPDRMPAPKERVKPLYHFELMHVRLAEVCDTGEKCKTVIKTVDTAAKKTDSLHRAGDTAQHVKAADSGTTAVIQKDTLRNNCGCIAESELKLWHINTILLLMVALAGFLGNMIHIATSFTNFVGAGKFERSWLLWYCVKPFTASSLAVGIYFVFRGGFLNMSDDSANINLYGVMTISLLAGLFTDRATQKLKEVFEVLFKPKEERPDPLVAKAKIQEVTPAEIEPGKENLLTLKGENLENKKLTATINDEVVTVTGITKTGAVIRYNIPDSQKDKTSFDLIVKDEEGNIAGKQTLKLKQAPPPGTPVPPPAPNPAGGNTAPPPADADTDDDSDETNPGQPVIKE